MTLSTLPILYHSRRLHFASKIQHSPDVCRKSYLGDYKVAINQFHIIKWGNGRYTLVLPFHQMYDVWLH